MKIEIQNVSKEFGTHVALDNLSFVICEGTLTSLLGPSGCGKTTLLRLISGLEQASSGNILIDGQSATAEQQRLMGFVFQHYALFQHMTAFENVAFGLRVKPKAQRLSKEKIAEQVHEVLSLVQLDNQSHKYPQQLSGGQQQRIALARVLAIRPKVLLLDEPFGALDATVRRDLRRWLRQLHEDIHMTTILVTHDQEEALEISDQVVLLNQGRLEQCGSPREIYQSPKTPFAYEFLGVVNVFSGRWKDHHLVHFAQKPSENASNPQATQSSQASQNLGSVLGSVGGGAGDEAEALAEDLVPFGDNAVAYVRPHDLRLHAERQSESDLKGQIIRVSFVATDVRIEIRLCGPEPLLVEAQLRDAEWQEKEYRVGDTVYLRSQQFTLFPQAELLTTKDSK